MFCKNLSYSTPCSEFGTCDQLSDLKPSGDCIMPLDWDEVSFRAHDPTFYTTSVKIQITFNNIVLFFSQDNWKSGLVDTNVKGCFQFSLV